MGITDTGLAQATGALGKAKGVAGKTKGAVGKGQAAGKKLFWPLAATFLSGMLLGALSLIDPFNPDGINMAKVILGASTVGALVAGVYWAFRYLQSEEGGRSFWREFGVTALAALALGLGMVLAHLLLPELFGMGSSALAWVICPASIGVLLPMLLDWVFRAAIEFEPQRYELWHFPLNYRERQHAWNRDRIVIANFHFKRDEREGISTSVSVKLPEDAQLGELVYLFIKDYNENRFPNTPILDLTRPDGGLGWIFRKPRQILIGGRKWSWSSHILDPQLTIAENKITRDSDVIFERVFEGKQAS